MAEYLTHKVVNIDKVKVKHRLTLEEYEKKYEANAKYDGCFAFVQMYPNGYNTVESRTGEQVLSMDMQAAFLHDLLSEAVDYHNGLVVLAEAWSPVLGQNVISGYFRDTKKQHPELRFVVFDCLTVAEYEAGHSPVPFSERMGRLAGKLVSPLWYTPDPDTSYCVAERAERWAPGTYDALRLTNTLVEDPRGFDGLILADQEGTWTAGRGTTGEKVRIKRNLTFDLKVTAVHEGVGEKTGRPVYTISVSYGGKELRVGSGIPHDFKRVPRVGDIVEVMAMDYSSDGLLREPRFKGIRYDKEEPDT